MILHGHHIQLWFSGNLLRIVFVDILGLEPVSFAIRRADYGGLAILNVKMWQIGLSSVY